MIRVFSPSTIPRPWLVSFAYIAAEIDLIVAVCKLNAWL